MRDSPASVVDDVFYDTPDVAISLCKVEVAQTSRGFVVVRMGLELDKRDVVSLVCCRRDSGLTYDGV